MPLMMHRFISLLVRACIISQWIVVISNKLASVQCLSVVCLHRDATLELLLVSGTVKGAAKNACFNCVGIWVAVKAVKMETQKQSERIPY